MRYLEKYYPGRRHGTVNNLVGAAVGVLVYGGASYGFGYAQNKYREKASLFGVPADLLTGAVLTGASALGLLGHGTIGHLGHDIGKAGVGAFFHTLGAGHGGAASGLTRAVVPKNQVSKLRAAVPSATILGEIPKAPHGDFLKPGDLAVLAR